MKALLRRVRALWWRRTLRFRITAVAVAVTLVVLLSLAVLTSNLMRPLLVTSADTELDVALSAVLPEVRAGRVPDAGPVGMQVHVLDTAGDPVDGRPKPVLDVRDVRELKAGTPVLRTGEDPPQRWVGTVVTAPDGAQRLVVVGTALVGYRSAPNRALNWLVLAAFLGAAAAGVATWFAVRSSLRPVERIRRAAARLPSGSRLPLPEAHDELRSLAAALNGLLARRDEASDRLRRFTGDAAHELRSPVASIRVQAEVAVANPDPELSHEVLGEVVRESERLSTLVDGLLTLARSDAGELPTAEPVDVAVAARDAVARLGSADGPAVSLHVAGGAAWVSAAPSEVDLVLDNLLRNAVRHARAQVTVSVLLAASSVRLVVDDDGYGVPEEHRARVFDRFYRVQDDRARSSGGAGLGLALVAEVVRRRGGTVHVGESPDGGARFQVRWPALRA
ncbi:MAG TPA: HAMP domain-containing sensor histidine kinase [Actinophytocola sp.]|uniref:sensor histidine kinase n=1 Tax=Actinophytocola sp. TaxID=1872138 RepID=UPI002DDD74B6|nr:HAMP domain-containing sensor histidine kinase [Actinophytocola sp.]HEV2781938.1 HAMP domain-containing sensor histidine kinase [Actinophytocola sp.]